MIQPIRIVSLLLLLLASYAQAERVEQFTLPESGNDLVGVHQWTTISSNETLVDLADRFHMGYNLLKSANPEVDAWLPEEGVQVLLPGETILPRESRKGVVINVAEMRLYYYHQNGKGQALVDVYPISVGRGEWLTPITVTQVTGRVKDPVWYPPESIRAEHAARGDFLPKQVPAGPNNPLGNYLLSLGIPSYFIHGTNKRFGIGMQVTHGCIRMYPDDIEQLVKIIPTKTQVTIINQPFKAGWRDDELYLEVHPPLETNGEVVDIRLTDVVNLLIETTKEAPEAQIDWDQVELVLAEAKGIPQKVGLVKADLVPVSKDTPNS